ncbi:hypothetical protein HYT02_05710 [Candidatus Gottesmanbacteria bacterium]|nr:hypothetical protein [Candidatus Gottesmanbacteria bacterium]
MIGANSIQSRGLLVHRNPKYLPVKVYPFAAHFGDIYAVSIAALRSVSDVLERNEEILRNPSSKSKNLFGIAFPWGEIVDGTPKRELELSVFAFDGDFADCNPEVYVYTFTDGALTDRINKYCETGLVILGAEANLRRKVAANGGDLSRYLREWPDLGTLGPIEDRTWYVE